MPGRLLTELALSIPAVQSRLMRRARILLIPAASIIFVGAWAAFQWWRSSQPRNPLTARDGAELVVIDTRRPFELEPPPPGWRHRTFWLVRPMRLAFATIDGVPALRCQTNGSGSIYGRHTDIELSRVPVLTWRWRVEVPVTSALDERTREGDDHPVRFFLEFADSGDARHRMEIIWANRAFKRGDWKYIGGFAHYVADGGDENIGAWRDEEADLIELYRAFTKRSDLPRLTFLGLFCDTDNSGGRSVADTADVRLRAR